LKEFKRVKCPDYESFIKPIGKDQYEKTVYIDMDDGRILRITRKAYVNKDPVLEKYKSGNIENVTAEDLNVFFREIDLSAAYPEQSINADDIKKRIKTIENKTGLLFKEDGDYDILDIIRECERSEDAGADLAKSLLRHPQLKNCFLELSTLREQQPEEEKPTRKKTENKPGLSLKENRDYGKRDIEGLPQKWTSVIIEFIDSETIRVKFNKKAIRYKYNEIGFQDKRKKHPDTRWNMLLEMAEKQLTNLSHFDSRYCTKLAAHAIRKRLKKMLPIDDDPIPWNHKKRQYEISFTLKDCTYGK